MTEIQRQAEEQSAATELLSANLPITLHGRHAEDLSYNYGCGSAFILAAIACFIFVLLKRTDMLAGWSFGIMLLTGAFGSYLLQSGFSDYIASRFMVRLSDGGLKFSRGQSILVFAWDEIQRLVMREGRSYTKAKGNPTLALIPTKGSSHEESEPAVTLEVEVSGSPGCFRFNAVHLPDLPLFLAITDAHSEIEWECSRPISIPKWQPGSS